MCLGWPDALLSSLSIINHFKKSYWMINCFRNPSWYLVWSESDSSDAERCYHSLFLGREARRQRALPWLPLMWAVTTQGPSFWWGSQAWSNSMCGLAFPSVWSTSLLWWETVYFSTSSQWNGAFMNPCFFFCPCWQWLISFCPQLVCLKHSVSFGWGLEKSHSQAAWHKCSSSTTALSWTQPF